MNGLNDDEATSILAELRAISDRSATSRFDHKKLVAIPVKKPALTGNGDESKEHDMPFSSSANLFLESNPEDSNLNQYWYSSATIQVLSEAISEIMASTGGTRVAFLSTPSLYFALPAMDRKNCKVFDVSTMSHDSPDVQHLFVFR